MKFFLNSAKFVFEDKLEKMDGKLSHLRKVSGTCFETILDLLIKHSDLKELQ